MALNLLIPKLEWNENNLSGTTSSGSPIITGIADTSLLKTGMVVKGTNLVDGSEIIDISASTITLDTDATGTGATSVTALYRFEFNYPPSADTEDKITTKNKITTSLSGLRQKQTEYIEATRDLVFDFLTKDQRITLQNLFYLGWASPGNTFKFFLDKDDSEFTIYELNNYAFAPGRQVKKHPYFLYKLNMSFRRVIDDVTLDAMLLESGDNLLTEDGDNILLEG